MKKLLRVMLCLALCGAVLTGCSTGEGPSPSPSPSPEASDPAEAVYQIGLVQYQEHTSLNTLREAFMGRLEEWGCDETQVEIDYQNAGGDPAKAEEICQGFVEDEVDMIVAISTPAAQAAIDAAKDSDVTVVYTGVASESALEVSGGSVTGVVAPTSGSALLDLARQGNGSLATVGLLYNPDEPGSQAEADQLKTLCSDQGLEVIESPVTSQEGAAEAATKLCAQVDAVFTPADNTVAPVADQVAAAIKEAGKPWYVGSDAMVQGGALASISVASRDQGVKAADTVVKLIEGEDLANVPVYTFTSFRTFVNQTTLAALEGTTFPEETLQGAFLYQ